ncbi:MAG TPA: MASE3 domain-containing protein, partial [Clostridia bacterium]|nr:MASE3 domain-containing protein [Clostridia bacterium]
YEGMGVFEGYTSNLPTQLWISARFMESITLLLALIFIRKRVALSSIIAGWTLVFAAVLFLIFSGVFPVCYIPGQGLTTFKKTSELVIVTILSVALILLYKKRELFSHKIIWYLYGSILLTISAEFAFIAYVGVYDLSNLIGHYFKIVSFYLIYRGIIVTAVQEPYALLMQRLQERNRELEAQRREIDRSKRISDTMLNNIPEEIALLDRESLKIIDVNQTFLEVHSRTKDEVIGGYCYRITHGRDEVCRGEKHFCPLYVQEKGTPVVHTHLDRKGEQRFVEVSVWPVIDNGRETKEIVHIARDITAQKRVEQLRNDMERIVRHDLKSPLNGIIGGSQILLDYENPTAEQRAIIEAIHSSGNSILKMIDNSMDLYKMEEGLYEIERSWLDVAALFRRLSARWTALKKAKQVELLFILNGSELNSSSQYNIHAEEQTIESLLANLIENAIEAAPEKTTVTVQIKSTEAGFLFDIHNYGVIPGNIRSRFFERYITYGKEHGTGLGTYSAFLITRAYGGTIYFTSEKHEGTHLLVEIPS